MTRTIKKPSTAQYDREKVRLALSYCPPIAPCPRCGWPKVYGYVCNNCPDPVQA